MVGRKENRLESAHSCIHICVLLMLCFWYRKNMNIEAHVLLKNNSQKSVFPNKE